MIFSMKIDSIGLKWIYSLFVLKKYKWKYSVAKIEHWDIMQLQSFQKIQNNWVKIDMQLIMTLCIYCWEIFLEEGGGGEEEYFDRFF